MRCLVLELGLLLLTGAALGEELQDNPNTVEKFHLEESDFYRVNSPGGERYAFLGEDWYGWWQRSKTQKSYLYFGQRGFGYVRLPVPDEDAVLPVFGRLYRVSGKPREFTSRTFSLITPEHLADGLGIEQQSMVAPLQEDGVGQLLLLRRSAEGKLKIKITRIDGDDEKQKAYGTAFIDPIPGPERTPDPKREVTLELEEGDVLTLDQRIFKVVRIVPKDFKGTKTIGWVEFAVEWKR